MPSREAIVPQIGLGKAIETLRRSARLAPTELAEGAGLDVRRLKAIENGGADPEPDWAEMRGVARALVVTLTQLAELSVYFESGDKPIRKSPESLLKGWARSRCQIPPPFSDYELKRVGALQQRVLARRYGLADGLSRNYDEIGHSEGFTEGRARTVEGEALVKIRRQRDPHDAFAAGARMVDAELVEGLMQAPYERGGVARRKKFTPRATGGVAQQLVACGFRVTGSEWSLERQKETAYWTPRWVVFCGEQRDGRIGTASLEGGGQIGKAHLLAVIPAKRDGHALRGWLERMAFEHQVGRQSLAFLIGGLSVLLKGSVSFSSVGDVEAALMRRTYSVPEAIEKFLRAA